MTVATSAGGRPLKLIQTLLGLAIAGATLVGIPSTAGAAATPAGPPNGIEVLSPQEDQTLGSTPVPVSVRFTTAILAGSFAAELNGKDVTSRFTVGADTASAALTEADGIRIRTDKTPQSNTLQVWMTGHDDPSHRFHDRRAFVVKSGSQLPAPVSGVIPPSGGTLESPGFARVTFPAGGLFSDPKDGVSLPPDPLIHKRISQDPRPPFR